MGESERISRLINQVLDIEKIQSEARQAPPPEPIDLNEIIKTAVTGMEPLFRERGITVRYHHQGAQAILNGQRDRLIQVVVNLLSNAQKFCDPEKGLVEISLEDTPDRFLLKVSDNGKGIPEASQDFIFGQFTQLNHSGQGKPQGTGLGLYITKQIVEQHRGRILVESAPGQGATFVVILPKN